jgi:hypothetical protein
MPNATIPLTSFTGGEWSPRLHGRVDIQKYNTACEVLQNMVIYPHGGITRRMGMEYIEDAKTNAVRLIPFEYNREQAYVLEFGENYIRFFRNGAQIAPLGTPLEITTTFLASELDDLAFAQSNDVMYIVHEKHAPIKLTRTGPDTFTLTTVTFTGTPSEWGVNNYPRAVTFFQSRLVMGGCPNNPQTIWLSKVADLENFTVPGSGVVANDALKYVLSSTQNNATQWIVPGSKLLIGTTGGEFSLDLPGNNGLSVQVKRESNFGSKNSRTQLVGSEVIYTSRDGKKVRGMSYSFDADGYVSPELSLLSEHLTRPGIKEYDFAQNPDGILWTVLTDGTFVGFTYLKSQEVQGWHRHSTNGLVKSICTIEGDTGSEVWFATYRNGATRIERMAQAFEGEDPSDLGCAYLDSYLTYSGSPTSTVSGLTHLNGMTVSVLGDGMHLQDRVVSAGSITLEKACSKIIVGLKNEWRVVPLRLEGGSPMGFSQGKRKHLESLIVRFERSAGLNHKIKGGAFESELPSRNFGQNFDSAVPLFTGDKVVKLHNSWNREGQFELHGDSPLPVTILMIGANVVVNE